MRFHCWGWSAFGLVVVGQLAVQTPTARAQAWPGHAHDAQHTVLSSNASQVPAIIRWSIPVDLDPQYSGGELLTHYGSPLITGLNTVLVPVKTGATGGFRIEAHQGRHGRISSGNMIRIISCPVTTGFPPGAL